MSQDPTHTDTGRAVSYNPNLISTTRLATPPLKGRSLLSMKDDGDIAPHFSLLLHPDADVDEFQNHIDNNHNNHNNHKNYNERDVNNGDVDTNDANIGTVMSTDVLPIPADIPNILPSPTPQTSPDHSTHTPHHRIKDNTTQIISPSTLQAAREQNGPVVTPQDVANALNLNLLDDPNKPIDLKDAEKSAEFQSYQHPVTIRGICKAQSLVRGYLARMRARKQLMLQAWKELDTKEEQELSLNNNQYNNLRTLVDNDTSTALQNQLHQQQLQQQTSSQSPLTQGVSGGNVSESPLTKGLSGSPLIRALTGPDFDEEHPISIGDSGSHHVEPDHDEKDHKNDVIVPQQHHEEENDNNQAVVIDEEPVLLDAKPQLSITSSRGTVENGLYRPASGLSFGDDDGRISLNDLHIPQGALAKKSIFGELDDSNAPDWIEKVQTRMQQLRVLREFREHAVPHPSTQSTIAGSNVQDIAIDWAVLDQNIGNAEENDFFYSQAPHFRSRLIGGYKINKTIISRYPRANLPLLTSTALIDLQWVHSLRDELAGGRIPIAPIVERLILLTFSILCKEPNVQDVTVPHNGKVTVVGDIHGQLADLLSIFRLNGTPSASNIYVFNGDWVDRGSQSIEVIVLLLAWKALYPQYVFLNRGNHEAADINSRDGFEKECKDKYGVGIFPLFSELFSAVPIACRIFGSSNDIPSNDPNATTVVPQKPAIFVTHGGIPQKGLTIDQIQQENRFYTIPRTNSIIFNMLWSDPSPYKGTYPSSRGAGYEFGPDVTLDFLRSNRCCMLIRSHECVEQGWQLSHHNMCLTVFSASNYQKSVGNQGGYCIIESSLRPTLVTFYAEASNQLAARSSIRFKRLESSVVQKLMDRIAIHRLDLISHYNRIAQENVSRAKRGELVEALNTNAALPCSDQIISRQQWADGLREVLGVNIPFLLFQEQLGLPDRGVLGDERGPINYMAFLTPFTPKNDLFKEIDSTSSQDLHSHRPTSPGSNVSGLSGKNVNNVTNNTNFSNNPSVSDYHRLIQYDSTGQPILTPDLSRIALAQLSQLLYSHRYEVENVFRFLDLDNNGSVTREEFVTGIYNLIVLFRAKVTKMRQEHHPDCETYANNASLLLEIDWDKNNLGYFADIVDQNGDGDINYSEFVTHFQFDAQNFETSSGSSFSSALVKK